MQFRCALALLLLAALGACAAPQPGSPIVAESWMVPGGPGRDGRPAMLPAKAYLPAGAGPFPAVVINHGSPGEPARQFMEMPDFRHVAEWFVRRGYVAVVPMRRGYGEAGDWPENPGPCANPDFLAAGKAAADDIIAVVARLRALRIVRPDRILLVGQSAGGFGVVAAISRNPAGVFGAINIAGGRLGGEEDARCAPERLVAANAAYGETGRVPSLWLYTENDSYFGPDLSRAMVSAYGGAGGRAVYILLPPYKDDGHRMFGDAEGLGLWTPYAASFLEALE